MSRVAIVASNTVLCAVGVTLLVEAVQGHRPETILLRASVVTLAVGMAAIVFLMLWRRFQASSPAERPAAAPAPEQTAAPVKAGR